MPDTKVTKLYPKDAAKSPDAVLEQAVGNFDSVVVLGLNKEGRLDVRADLGLTDVEINWLLDKAKAFLVNGFVLGEDA
jgi:hypothetical protein